MDQEARRRVFRATAWMAAAAVLLYVFFQVNKGGPFRDINPFGQDPYDVVGSLAIQVALLLGVLNLARALRLRDDPGQAANVRLILRGNLCILAAILATLIADAVAVLLHPLPPTRWGMVLRVELAGMALLALVCVGVLLAGFGHVQGDPPPHDLTPADAIDDLWTLVRVPARACRAILPRRIGTWIERFRCDQLFVHIPWISPRLHPWRFACALGLLVGLGLDLAQLQEGLPPSVQAGLLVMAVFVSAELVATLLGFAFLGGYLGLRPTLRSGEKGRDPFSSGKTGL
jgi:hypothetical protein